MRGELFDPTQVPTFPVEIDYAHPLAQGLGGLYIPALGGCDIVGAGPPLTYPGGIAGGTFGPGAGSTTSDYASIEPAPVSWLTASEVTLVAICTMGSTAALDNAAFFEISYDSSGAAPYLVWGLNTNNVADFAVYLNNVGNFNSGNQSTTPPPINSSFAAAGTIVIGGNSIAYLNGNSIYTAPASTPGPNYTSTSYIKFNVNTKAVMHAGSIYLRALAPELIAWLSAEPFAMLRRRHKRVRYYAAPASGTFSATTAARTAAAASLIGTGALRATTAGGTAQSASLSGRGILLPSAMAIKSAGSSAILGKGTLGSSSAITAPTAAKMSGPGKLAAASAMATGTTGEVGGIGALASASAIIVSAMITNASITVINNSLPGSFSATMRATTATSVKLVGAGPMAGASQIAGQVSASIIGVPAPVSPLPPLWNLGYTQAARMLGNTYTQFRPTGPSAPLTPATTVANVLAWITTDKALKGTAQPERGKDRWYAAIDRTNLMVGDYLVGPDGTYFVTETIWPAPVSLAWTNHIITVARMGSDEAPGASDDYGGFSAQEPVPVLTGWPAWIVERGHAAGTGTGMRLPTDSKLPLYEIKLPALANTLILWNDIIIDETGRRYTVAVAEQTPLGWRLSAEMWPADG